MQTISYSNSILATHTHTIYNFTFHSYVSSGTILEMTMTAMMMITLSRFSCILYFSLALRLNSALVFVAICVVKFYHFLLPLVSIGDGVLMITPLYNFHLNVMDTVITFQICILLFSISLLPLQTRFDSLLPPEAMLYIYVCLQSPLIYALQNSFQWVSMRYCGIQFLVSIFVAMVLKCNKDFSFFRILIVALQLNRSFNLVRRFGKVCG